MISRKQLGFVTLFTLVETIVLSVWILLLNSILAAIVILFLGLFLEHYIATLTGNFPLQRDIRPQQISLQTQGFVVLKMDRAKFTLLIVLTNALSTLTEGLILVYAPAALTVLLVGAIQTVANGLIVYFSTEQQSLPSQPPAIPA